MSRRNFRTIGTSHEYNNVIIYLATFPNLTSTEEEQLFVARLYMESDLATVHWDCGDDRLIETLIDIKNGNTKLLSSLPDHVMVYVTRFLEDRRLGRK